MGCSGADINTLCAQRFSNTSAGEGIHHPKGDGGCQELFWLGVFPELVLWTLSTVPAVGCATLVEQLEVSEMPAINRLLAVQILAAIASSAPSATRRPRPLHST